MKTVLITGASSGIGKACAYVYAEKGYQLILAARRIEQLEEIKNEIENRHQVSVNTFGIDLSEINSAEDLYQHVKDSGMSPNVLINNAGYGINGFFKDIGLKKEENMLVLNIITLMKLSKLFIKDMVEAHSGHIINISSTGGFQGVPKMASYAASKAYVLHFSEALAYELKKDGVRVTAICPGPTKSEFAETAQVREGHFTKAPTSRQLAEFIYSSMEKGRVTAIQGFKNRLMAFSGRFGPRKMITAAAGKLME
jgi:short-subunit dehydrogenase